MGLWSDGGCRMGDCKLGNLAVRAHHKVEVVVRAR